VFEKNSISLGIPSEKFIVDSTHPICTQKSYKIYGNLGFKPAKSYINGDNIYLTSWDKATNLLPGENKRYAIVMPSNSCKAYIANEIVVRSRQSHLVSGYGYD